MLLVLFKVKEIILNFKTKYYGEKDQSINIHSIGVQIFDKPTFMK